MVERYNGNGRCMSTNMDELNKKNSHFFYWIPQLHHTSRKVSSHVFCSIFIQQHLIDIHPCRRLLHPVHHPCRLSADLHLLLLRRLQLPLLLLQRKCTRIRENSVVLSPFPIDLLGMFPWFFLG